MRTVLMVLMCLGYIHLCAETPSQADERFNGWKERFTNALWKVYPSWASSVGYHKYDHILVIPNDADRNRQLSFCQMNLDSLKKFDLNDLSANNKTDHHLIENQLRSSIWGIKELRSYEWNPAEYNVCGDFADLLNNDYDSLARRINNFYIRMAAVPAYYEAAKKNLKNPTKEHTALAIEQNLGGISVFEHDFPEALKKIKIDSTVKAKYLSAAATCATAIRGYADYLKALENTTPRSFRLGKDLYEQKFAFELQSGYTAAEIYKKALQHKDELHEKMFDIAMKLWPKYYGDKVKPANRLALIKMVIDTLSTNHVKPEEFQTAIEQQLPVLETFIKNKKLLYIDPSKPLVVRKEPAYMAGVAGASINAPGPYDKNGNTWYNVGSLAGWDKDRAESYLREYNHYILQILNIHEAIPGHYTQLVYANKSPSIVKSILGSSYMIEGWAVYGERMMLENGYDGDRGVNSTEASPEMWLMYYKWNLRSTCNTILDYSVHMMDMSKDDAMHLLVDEAFQQKAEAEGKWKRVSVTQVQLCCYFTGYTEIYDFREELKNKMKRKFNLKQFHEKFLSYGSSPVKYIKELMLAEM